MKTLAEKKRALATLYQELEKGGKELSEGKVDQARGDELEAKAKEAEAIQSEVENAERIINLGAKGREVKDPAMPAGTPETKAVIGSPDGSPIVGYIRAGDAFVDSPEFKAYQEGGRAPGSTSAPMRVKSFHDRGGLIVVTQKMVEQKAVPTIGAAVITPDRISDVVRSAEPQKLRMRDVLDVSRTSSSVVEYVTIVSSANAAAPVAQGDTKPEADMELATATAPVRTLAVWLPVTEQQLSDVPQISGLINGELMYDLKRLEERQFLYGSGAGQNLQGIIPLAGVPSITRGAQNLDRIRAGITDVALNGYEPNAVVIHPLDWEAIVLLKGTSGHYLWTVVTDAATGQSRVWGISVIETAGAQKPTITGPNTIYQRNMLVGDFRRGATVFDREDASVQVGWINDQFVKNMRTLRAEERLAFAIKRPKAFAKYQTQAEA